MAPPILAIALAIAGGEDSECLEPYAECTAGGRCPAGFSCDETSEHWAQCNPTPEYKRLAWQQCGTVAGETGDRPQECGAGLFCDRDSEWYAQCRPIPDGCGHGPPPPERRSTASCTASGDPHYTTFDGAHYSFQGQCEYRLAATDCSTGAGVEVQVRNSANVHGVTVTEAVAIRVPGIGVFEFYGERDAALLNGAAPPYWPAANASEPDAELDGSGDSDGEAAEDDGHEEEEDDEGDYGHDEEEDDEEEDANDDHHDRNEDAGEDDADSDGGAFDFEECLDRCFAAGFLNTLSGASCNQMLSCGQACQMRADGATPGECRSHCGRNGSSGCRLNAWGRTYDMCARCDAVPGSSCTGPADMSPAACKAGCGRPGNQHEARGAAECGAGSRLARGFSGWYSACSADGCVVVAPLRTKGFQLSFTAVGADHAGVVVSWDRHRAEVELSSEHRGQACGLCGDYDDRPSNDAGLVWAGAAGSSEGVMWQAGASGFPSLFSTVLDRDGSTEWGPACGAGPAPPPPAVDVSSPCDAWTDGETAAAAEFCGVMARADGPYGSCQVDPGPYVANCMLDICHGGRDIACDSISDYEAACVAKEADFSGSAVDRCGVCFGDGTSCSSIIVGTGVGSSDPGAATAVVCIPGAHGAAAKTVEVPRSAVRGEISAGAMLGPCPSPATTFSTTTDAATATESATAATTTTGSVGPSTLDGSAASSLTTTATEEPATTAEEQTTTAPAVTLPTAGPIVLVGGGGMGDYSGRFSRLDVVIGRDFSTVVKTEAAGRTVGSRTAAALQDHGIRVWKAAVVEGSVVVQMKLASDDLPAARGAFAGCGVCIVLPDGTDACPHLAGSPPCDVDSDEVVLEETPVDDPAGAEGSAGAAAGTAGAAVAAVVAVLAIGFVAVRRRRAAGSRDATDDIEAEPAAAARPHPSSPVDAASLSFSTLQSHQYEYEVPVNGGSTDVPVYEEPGPGDSLRAASAANAGPDVATYAECGVGAPADYACAGSAPHEAEGDYALAGDGPGADDAIYAFATEGAGGAAPEYEVATALCTLRRGEGSADVDYAIADGCASIRRASLHLEQSLAAAGEPDYDIAA